MKSQLHRVQTRLSGLALAAVCAVLISQAKAATALPPADASQPKTAEAIPWSQIGAKAGADYKGDGLTVTRTESGARLRCVFQKLEGDATSEGLWLTSAATDAAIDRFRVVASSVGRDFGLRRQPAEPKCSEGWSAAATPLSDVREMIKPEEVNVRSKSGVVLRFPPQSKTMPVSGDVSIDGQTVRFTRPGLVEEYTVSMDGVRQDFVILEKPITPINYQPSAINSSCELRVELSVTGAKVEQAADGARLVLENSGRKIAYNRLRVTDATGRELSARMEVTGSAAAPAAPVNASLTGRAFELEVFDEGVEHDTRGARAPQLAVLVNDTGAVYPVRIDPTFSDENWISMGGFSGTDGAVYAAVEDGSGCLYIGGQFTIVADVIATNIAKWNGTNWSALGLGISAPGGSPYNGGRVLALAVSGSNVYAGGDFTTAGGIPAKGIAKWNGAYWSSFDSGLIKVVYALAVSGEDVYAGGWTQQYSYDCYMCELGCLHTPSEEREQCYQRCRSVCTPPEPHFIAKWDGSGWSSLGSQANGVVYALAVAGGDLYAGGGFTTIGGRSATNIAKWNGSSWSALGSGMNGGVFALAVSGNDVYAGGDFTTAGGRAATNVAKWNGSTWSGLGLGMGGVTYPYVYSLAVSGSDLYAGGAFTKAGGVAANRVAKWNGSSWSALGLGMDSDVRALAVGGSYLYAGGFFTTATNAGNVTVAANYVAKWNGGGWEAMGASFGLNDTVRALAISGGDLYVGGSFTTAGGNAANRVAKWNGSSWSALGSGMNGTVYSLAVSGSDLYAGGSFTTAGGNAANWITKWNGSSWSALGSGMDGLVLALEVLDSDVYAGGVFTKAGGVAANRVAKWNGSSWSSLGLGMNNTVWAMAVSGSDLYAGGSFTTADGNEANRIAKWNGSSWSALGSGMNNAVYALAVSSNDVYIAGTFTATADYPPSLMYRIAKWNGNIWSALGLGINGSVFALAVSGSDLYAGGRFTTAVGVAANYITKWNGSSWSAMGSGMNNAVWALTVSGNNLYAGGDFLTSGGKVSAYLARAMIGIPPEITRHPVRRTNDAGTMASFNVSAVSDSAFGYLWIKNGSPLSDGGKVSGANTATLTLTNVLHADQGSFAVIVTNTWGSVTSAVATLTVIDPVITTQPQNQFVTVGDNATFTVAANGTPPLTYHWLKDGTNIQATTSASLTLSNAQKSGEGFYSAMVSNRFGVATSESASLHVNLPPVADASATRLIHVSPNGVNATVILDGSRSFDPDGDPLQFAWYESGVAGQLAGGAVAITALPAGTHPLLLVVSDPMASRTNGVTVAVLTTAQAVERLLALVNANPSLPKSLRATLNAALASIARGNSVSAINLLQAFQNQVRAQVAPELAATLTQAAQQIIDVLNGSNAKSGGKRNGRFTDVTREANGRVRMRFSAEAGHPYLIEASTNMVDWERIGVAQPLPNGGFEFAETPRGTFERRFYRIVTPGHSL